MHTQNSASPRGLSLVAHHYSVSYMLISSAQLATLTSGGLVQLPCLQLQLRKAVLHFNTEQE